MTKKSITNMAASVHERLLKIHREKGVDFQLLMTRYAIERLLYRINRSPYKSKFVLKGAMLFYAWRSELLRPTRDLDLLGHVRDDLKSIVKIFRSICSIQIPENDGLFFIADTIKAKEIKEEDEYPGIRVKIEFQLGKARSNLQVDIGFGDAITPSPVRIEYPSFLFDRGTILLAYPVETMIAEKFSAMIILGEKNSRLKDFYDLWAISKNITMKGARLIKAIKATFHCRRIVFPQEVPVALSSRFYEIKDRIVQWRAFIQKYNLTQAPAAFSEIGERLISFFEPLRVIMASDPDMKFQLVWKPKKGWVKDRIGAKENRMKRG